MNKLFRLRLSFGLKLRYGFHRNINNAIMSHQKRSASEVIESETVKKQHLTGTILSTKEFSELKMTSKMSVIEKHTVEVLETPDKSESDKKLYRAIQLENGLKALLISDPSGGPKTLDDFTNCSAQRDSISSEASTVEHEEESESEDSDDDDEPEEREKLSACCLSVGVGSFSDPRDIQGLAHFLEHMIFMGSEKYPGENELDRFVRKAGGFDNAGTDLDETSYYFEVREQCLDGALDRFSEIFKAPLMHKEAMTREREAVESEFQSKVNVLSVRRIELLVSICQEDHPASIFSWGNLKTLKENVDDETLYRRVHEFRRQHYSAHRMTVCLQARLPLDDLQDLVVKHFSSIANNKLPGLDFSKYTHENAFQSRFHEKVLFVKPIGNVSKLELTWCLPPQYKTYKAKPYHYVSVILGHEGKGSLISYLRKKLWAINLVSGIDAYGMDSNSLFCLFHISIELTDDGFVHLDEVVDAAFAFLRLLKRSGPSESFYNEVAKIEENTFRFADERDAVDNVEDFAVNLRYYPPKHIISGDSLYFEYDQALIQDAIDTLNTRKFNIMVTSFNRYDENVLFEQRDKWFGTEYTERDVPEKWINSWNNAQPYREFEMPEPNPYIAEDFTIFYDKAHPVPKYPTKLLDTDTCELWFRQDDKFLLPHAHFNFYFMTPLATASTNNMIMMTLYSTLLKYQLIEKLYPANIAGLGYKCYSADRGLVLKTSGYNQKLHFIVEEFVRSMKSLADDVTEEQFQVFVQQLFKTYESIFQKPSSIGNDLRLSVIEAHRVPLNVKNQKLKEIRFVDFQDFCRKFTQEMKIKVVMQGNLTQERALSITEHAINTLNCGKIQNPASYALRTTKVPEGATYLRANAFNPNDVNSVTTNYYQIGPISFRLQAIIDLLMEIAEEPVFDILRNKEQLGYDVSSIARDNYGILGYTVYVNSQENKFTVDHVDARIENFRNELLQSIEKMSEHEFAQFKTTLAKIKMTEDNKLGEEVGRNWAEITTEDYAFDRNNREVDELKTITKEELLKVYRATIGPNAPKFCVQVIGNPEAISENDKDKANQLTDATIPKSFDDITFADFKSPNNGFLIKDIAEYKRTLEIYPPTKTQLI